MTEDHLVKQFRRYQRTPVAYCREILGVSLSPEQEEILNALVKNHRISIRSGNSFGKSYALACAALWHFDCFSNSKTLITSGSQRQVRWALMNEVIQLARQSKLKDSYTINNTDITRVGHPSWFIMAFSSDEQGRVEGHHAPHLMAIADEARTISDDVLLGLLKCATEVENRLLFASVPGGCEGLFYATHTRLKGTWKTFRFPTGKWKHGRWKSIFPSRISDASIQERAELDGPDSPFFRSSVLAEWMESSEDSLVPVSHILKARENHLDPGDSGIVWGGDCARFGRDASALCKRHGACVLAFKQKRGLDVVSLASWFEMETQGETLCIDEIGVGAGVVDTLRAREIKGIVPVNVSKPAQDPEKYLNLKSELYWSIRQRFEKGEIDLTALDASTYDRLKSQLLSVRYFFTRGRLQIMSKEDLRRRGIESPDLVDALALSLYQDGAGAAYFEPVLYPSIAAQEQW